MTGGVVCFMERRIQGIGRILVIVLLEICGKVTPVGAKDIETGNRDGSRQYLWIVKISNGRTRTV